MAAINKELEHLCFDLVLVDTAHRNVEEERAEVEQAAKLLNEAYAKALQVENRLNSINLPELLGHKIQLYKMEAEKHHNEQVEMVKKREEVLANMENRDIGKILNYFKTILDMFNLVTVLVWKISATISSPTNRH